jgi:pyruvate/2-oxoglutarate dehydrogenase complex dihydrolipoamide dehydrogenase (E3) component
MNTTALDSSDQTHATATPEEFDIVLLGGGTGSTIAAWTFASEGKRVVAIDRKYIGGSCPNIACLPSKNFIHSAKVASYARRAEEFGIPARDFKVDMTAVRERKRRMVSTLNQMYLDNYQATGAELIMGEGRFIGPRTVQVKVNDGTTRTFRGTNVIISTGTHAAIEAIPGLIEANPLTHVEALELDELPEHLLVIGGGYIGLELAQAFRRLGSKVTLIEHGEQLVNREDDDVHEVLCDMLRDEGIDLLLDTTVTSVSGKSGESVQIALTQKGAQKTLQGTHVLVATGRIPNTKGIGLELAGVELTDRAYIKVNEKLQTTATNVWALGESAGSPQFTHISHDDFRVIHDNLSGRKHVTTGRQVPFCLFTDPECARVGLSEKDAQARGVAYRLFKMPMTGSLRALTLSETRGFLKALIEVDGDRILGFTAFCVDGGEVMSVVQIAMIAGLPYTALFEAVIAHPTMAESLEILFSSKPTVHNQPTSQQKGAAKS